MQEQTLDASILNALQKIDTPTICNALEMELPNYRSTGFTFEPLICPFPNLKPIVGYARTATIIASQPSSLSSQESRLNRLNYYSYVENGAKPVISVIQDIDDTNKGFGAFWGEINSNIHKALGCLGVITDGSIRDLNLIAGNFHILAGSVTPSHAHVHVVEFGINVKISGMGVKNDDLIHADRHGAVVIPKNVALKLPKAVELLQRKESIMLDACKNPNFSTDMLKIALESADDIH